MRALAELIMRGRTQALLVAVLATLLPLCYWFGAAAIGLVTLRRGPAAGAHILAWTLLAAGFWFMAGDPTPLMVVVGTYVLAVVLRQTVSWSNTLIAAMVAGVISSFVMEFSLDDLLRQVTEMTLRLLNESGRSTSDLSALGGESWLRTLILGGLGFVNAATLVGCLMTARSWQAKLYNPGGFQEEFHQLRLPMTVTMVLAGLTLLLSASGADLLRWMPLLLLPWMIAGLALIHAVVAKVNLGRPALIGFYLSGIFFGPYVITLLVLLAGIDSFVDIRKRIPAKN